MTCIVSHKAVFVLSKKRKRSRDLLHCTDPTVTAGAPNEIRTIGTDVLATGQMQLHGSATKEGARLAVRTRGQNPIVLMRRYLIRGRGPFCRALPTVRNHSSTIISGQKQQHVVIPRRLTASNFSFETGDDLVKEECQTSLSTLRFPAPRLKPVWFLCPKTPTMLVDTEMYLRMLQSTGLRLPTTLVGAQ